jgi:hypothetical protein
MTVAGGSGSSGTWGRPRLWQAWRRGWPMELTGIAAGLLIAIGVLVAGAGAVVHHWAAGHQDLLRAAGSRLGQLGGPHRAAGQEGRPPGSGREFAQGVLALLLITGLAVVMLAAVGLGKLVDDVTDGDAVAVVDHPVAQFVATHRVPALTAFMAAASTIGGPAGMVVLAVVAGVLLSVAWRSWAPVVIVTVTAAGVIGLTVVFKAALGLPRPPLGQAVAAADGYGFPSRARRRGRRGVCRGRLAVHTPARLVAGSDRGLGRGGDGGRAGRHLAGVPRRALDHRCPGRLDLRDLVGGGGDDRLVGFRPSRRAAQVADAGRPGGRGHWPLPTGLAGVDAAS